jgi:hypothetical protein
VESFFAAPFEDIIGSGLLDSDLARSFKGSQEERENELGTKFSQTREVLCRYRQPPTG